MDWFEKLFGFQEKNAASIPEYFQINGSKLLSLANQRTFEMGSLDVISLEELRQMTTAFLQLDKRSQVSEMVGDVQKIHQDPQNHLALFQVASQCNLLEMVSPRVTPEAGITGYQYDRTQGPACALAAAAGTLYRNYLIPLHGQIGQTQDCQVDTLSALHQAFHPKKGEHLWKMMNGYALASASGLQHVSKVIAGTKYAPHERDKLLGQVRIGIQWKTEVTLGISDPPILVSQAYCSAMPVAYSGHSSKEWQDLAQLVLDAAYEATILAAVKNFIDHGQNKVYLTLLGGGAFGNDLDWILSAMQRAIFIAQWVGLDIVIVSYGRSNPSVKEMIARYNEQS